MGADTTAQGKNPARDCTPEPDFIIMTYKEKYHAYLKSDKWAQMKLDLIEIRGQKCERCGAKRTFKYLHLHHLTYERIFHEEPSDLELLCSGCHVAEHGIEKPKKKPQIKRKKKLSKSDKFINKKVRHRIKRLRTKLKERTITVAEYAKRLRQIRRSEIKREVQGKSCYANN